jgi:hypothetical protein
MTIEEVNTWLSIDTQETVTRSSSNHQQVGAYKMIAPGKGLMLTSVEYKSDLKPAASDTADT